MAKTRSLSVVISGDEKDLTRAFHAAGKGVGDLEKKTKHHALGISKAMLGAAAGAASFGAAVGALKSSVTVLESLAKGTAMVSRTTGMDNKTASEWVSIAKTRGIEAKQLNMGFVALARNMRAGAQGTKASVDAFKELGVSQAVLKRGDASEVLNRVSDAFAKMPDGANKAALAQKLFSRQAGTLLPLLNKGSGELQRQLGVVDKYGAALDKHGVRQAMRAVQAQRELGLAWQGAQILLATKVLPVLTHGAEKLGKFVAQMRSGEGAGGRFAKTLGDIRDALAPVVKLLKDHPKLIAAAVGAWAAYRIGAVVALNAIKVSNFRKAFGIGKGAAAAEGAIAGCTYATTFAASSATGVGAAARTGRLRGAMMGAGKALGAVAGVALLAELASQIRGGAGGIRGIIENIFPLHPSGSSGGTDKLHPYIVPRKTPALKKPPGSKLTPYIAPHDRAGGARAHAGSVGVTAHVASRAARATAPRARASGGMFSQSQLAALWIQAGGPPDVADTMAAIAMAESGGNASIVNSIGATGLWQIHPAEPGSKDPLTNARQAVRKYRESGFLPWEAYTGPDGKGSDGPWQQFAGRGGSGSGVRGVSGGSRVSPRRARPHIRQGLVGKPTGSLGGLAPPTYGQEVADVGLAKAEAAADDSLPAMIAALQKDKDLIQQRPSEPSRRELRERRRPGSHRDRQRPARRRRSDPTHRVT